jgi:hypothetical protein
MAELRLPLKFVLYAMAHEDSHTTPLAALATLQDVKDAMLMSLRRSEGPVEDTVLDTKDTRERVACTPWLTRHTQRTRATGC